MTKNIDILFADAGGAEFACRAADKHQ